MFAPPITPQSSRSLQNGKFTSPRGEVEWSYPSDTVVVHRYKGTMTAEMVQYVRASLEAAVALGEPITLFMDAYEARDYESAFRLEGTEWFKAHRKQVPSIQVLHRSALVTMGLSIFNLALGGGVVAHKSRESFEAALAAASQRKKAV
jgi:hypothetical protein